ncbi:MAG: cytochrome c peroxidase [Sulfurimonas sp.]|uniref:cytochrome-c peroxidase n=1 Tax=Sulfurimonas sp. TaxID=2022749 RepID=UPI0039E67864
MVLKKQKTQLFIIPLSTLLFLGCSGGNGTSATTNTSNRVYTLIEEHNSTGNPATGKIIPLISSAKAQLGMKLFFSKALGGDKDAACVTCHHPSLGGGDNLSLSIGVAADIPELLGNGRTHNSAAVNYDTGYAPVPRNAPSTYNVALWDKAIFWDGRVANVPGGISTPDSGLGIVDANAGANLAAAQALFPITSHEEMRGFTFEAGSTNAQVRTHLEFRLNDNLQLDYIANSWQAEFDSVYGANSVTMNNILDAIGEYENSQLFIDTPWKSFVEGNASAISNQAQRGAILFYSSYQDGGVNCVACHSGDFFTDENYHVMAIPQVGKGKVAGDDDFGREVIDLNTSHRYAFRTPTLLNTELTGPWGHDGAYTTLEGIVSHMLDVDTAIAEYDTTLLDTTVKTTNYLVNTSKALNQLNNNKLLGISPHQNVSLSAVQINELVAFLKTLTDACLKDRSCIGKWIPDNSVTGPDELRLNAIDASSSLL